METLCDVFGYRSGGDNSYSIVGGTEIGNADEGGNAELCTPFTGDVAGEA